MLALYAHTRNSSGANQGRQGARHYIENYSELSGSVAGGAVALAEELSDRRGGGSGGGSGSSRKPPAGTVYLNMVKEGREEVDEGNTGVNSRGGRVAGSERTEKEMDKRTSGRKRRGEQRAVKQAC